jgi:putative zinc finger/helix-turn-helix YgiT family protein
MKKRTPPNQPIDELTCRNCGNASVAVEVFSDTIDFRGLELDVQHLEQSRCRACKFKFESDAQSQRNSATIRQAYSVERDRIRKRDGLLSGEEISAIRKTYSLSQRDAALLFGGGSNAFNKYETGEVLQSAAMDRLLRVSAQFGRPIIDTLNHIVDTQLSECNSSHFTLREASRVSILIEFQGEAGSTRYNFAIQKPESLAAVEKVVRDTTFESSSLPTLFWYSNPTIYPSLSNSIETEYNLKEV